jgi:DNA-binding MarR family transcriptional regulator
MGVRCPSMADPVDVETARSVLARDTGDALLRVSMSVQRAFDEASAEEHLTPLAARLLRACVEPVPQHELGERLGVDAARVSVVITALVGRGLLTRTRGRGDQRIRRPELTAAGTAAVERMDRRSMARSPLAATLDERQLRSLLRLLERVERGTGRGAPIASDDEGE